MYIWFKDTWHKLENQLLELFAESYLSHRSSFLNLFLNFPANSNPTNYGFLVNKERCVVVMAALKLWILREILQKKQ